MTNELTLSKELIEILKNFSTINKSIEIKSNIIELCSDSGSIYAIYDLEEPFDIESPIAIFDMSNFLSVLSVYKNPVINVLPEKNRLIIKEGRCSNNYGLVAAGVFPEVRDMRSNFNKRQIQLDFIFPQEKLTILKKMADLQRSTYIFFESVEDFVRVTVGNELQSSDNTWEVNLHDDIITNELSTIVKINVDDLKLIMGDYHVQITEFGISKWKSNINVEYYIGLDRREI